MAQFNFGSNTSTAATPNFGFGAKPAAPTFGTLGTPQQPSGSITFGTPIASVAPAPQTTGLNFASPAPTLNFGAPASSAPATGLSFGTPKTTGGLAFGSTSTPAPSFNFGAAATTANTGFSIGTPATSAGLSFGTPASTGGLLFGTPASTAPALNFGTPAPAASSTGFALGTATPTTTGLFSATSTPAPAGGLNFGAPATTGFTLGTSTSTAGLSFGAPNTTTGLFSSSFAAPATSTLNFSFGGAKTIATPTLGAATTTPSVGLGGVDTALNKSGAPAAGSANTIAAKENQVPNEILQTLESFKQFVKDQKNHSSDVSRGSARPFLKVGEDIDLVSTALSEIGNELQRNYQVATKLKNDSARCLHDAEMAQRTYDTPPGLQFENTAPLQYFIDLVNKFEQDLQAIRMQIDVTDKHIQSLQEPRFLTSQELAVGMRRLHDTFVALAGRLQSVHTQVESQKEQYLNMRKYILKDPTNIFVQPSKPAVPVSHTMVNFKTDNISGPTPFSAMGSVNLGMMTTPQQVPNKPPPAYPSTSINFGASNTQLPASSLLSTPAVGSNTSLFGNTTQLGQSPATDSGFQLQNPPLGNKRGKR